MKNQKILFLLILSLLPVFLLSGISFDGLNISNDDRLLFRTEFENQHALFVSALNDLSIQQLTAYPEKLHIVDNGRTIIAINRFGAARVQVAGGLPMPLPAYPSFAEGNVPLKGRLHELAASPDGRWILYIEPVSHAYGNLLLIETSGGIKRVISERVELSASDFPAKWSPDSRLFVYSKGGRLYHFPIVNDMSTLVDERFRLIGSGCINSVLWGHLGEFYYLSGNTLYRVRNPELFTRTIYGDFLSIGSVAAALPFDFDSGFDRFWIAPDSGSAVISKNGRGFFVFLLGENQNSAAALPFISVPFGTEKFNVFWTNPGQVAIIYSLNNETIVHRLEIGRDQIRSLASANVPASANAALSPDRSKAVFWGESGIEIWDVANWRLIQRLRGEPVFSCGWVNNEQIISGNARFLEEITITGSNLTARRICLSGADEFGFETVIRGSARILARTGSDWFATDGRSPWVSVSNPQMQQVSLSSDRFRVFLEPQPSGYFKNLPMIRNVYSTGTVSLMRGHSVSSLYSSVRQSQTAAQQVAPQIALCFDLYDDDTGLQQVLSALRRHNIRATFFLNGDFIRRNPAAASAIARAGHETASLFYAPIDFSDSRYRITHEFITQGLARNEDEFHRATGRELSLLWHPPLYRSSALTNTASAAAGYVTVTRTIDPGDWLSRDDALRLGIRQISASEMIEQIMAKRSANAVVPIRLGLLPGGREDYLFQRIDILLDALIRSGVEVVPVSNVVR